MDETKEKNAAKEIVLELSPNTVKHKKNGLPVHISPAPSMQDGFLVVSIEQICELIGAKCEKDGNKRIITLKGG